MGENATEQNAVVKSEPNDITKEDVLQFTSNLQKGVEATTSLFREMRDFRDKEQDRKMRMLIYADKSMKWDKNFEEIKKRNDQIHDYMLKVFDKRHESIDKAFKAIDKGLEENNMELIRLGFGSMTEIVAKNPIAEAATEYELFKSGKISELEPE